MSKKTEICDRRSTGERIYYRPIYCAECGGTLTALIIQGDNEAVRLAGEMARSVWEAAGSKSHAVWSHEAPTA